MMASGTSVIGATNEILLVEKSAMIGSIIVSTARQLQLRPVRLVTNCDSAQLFLENQVFCGLITSLDEAGAALNMIHQLRQGKLRCDAKMPVAVTTSQCDMPMANRIKSLSVQRILLKPFKIRDLVTTIQTLVATPSDDTLRSAEF
jgi:DNA-binding NtrC family response regulator